MELILGGAYQGKLTWAAEKYALSREDAWDLTQGLPEGAVRCVYHLEALTWAEAQRSGSSESLLEKLLPRLPSDAVVIAREVGSGVVPMDPTERLWRELHGGAVKALALKSAHVTRIFCGLPEVLK